MIPHCLRTCWKWFRRGTTRRLGDHTHTHTHKFAFSFEKSFCQMEPRDWCFRFLNMFDFLQYLVSGMGFTSHLPCSGCELCSVICVLFSRSIVLFGGGVPVRSSADDCMVCIHFDSTINVLSHCELSMLLRTTYLLSLGWWCFAYSSNEGICDNKSDKVDGQVLRLSLYFFT